MTYESVDVQMERSFPGFSCFGKFLTGTLVGIFTVNLADARTDGTADRHTDGQMDFQVASGLGRRQTSNATDIWMDLS